MGVESRRNKQKFGLELFKSRLNEFIKDPSVTDIADVRGEWNIECEVAAAAYANFVYAPDARIEVRGKKMHGNKQYRIVFKEYVLGSIPVVDVEIDDCNPFDFVSDLDLACGDSHVVKNTKATDPICFSVVAGRAHEGKAIVGIPDHDLINGCGASARRQSR